MIKQFYFKLLNLAYHLFAFSSIWLIDRTLSGATIPGHSGRGTMAVMGYSALLKAQYY